MQCFPLTEGMRSTCRLRETRQHEFLHRTKCLMLPYEVVVRREAHGSYLKRNPHFSKGQLFPQLIVEFFLKTKDKNWKGKSLICDDPLLIYQKEASQIQLFNPAKPIHGQEPFLVLS